LNEQHVATEREPDDKLISAAKAVKFRHSAFWWKNINSGLPHGIELVGSHEEALDISQERLCALIAPSPNFKRAAALSSPGIIKSCAISVSIFA
jgi:hypothetical protein